MAKLNWQKIHTQSLMQSAREQEWQENRLKQAQKRANILAHDKKWQIGKHKGKEVSKLPLNYLCFVSETFDKKSPFKQRADKELRRRYKISTQG